jgi:hypothetical protein
MNFKAILQEIDAEIEKLTNIRTIMAGLTAPVRRSTTDNRDAPLGRRKSRVSKQEAKPPSVQIPIPRFVLLPPVHKREYAPRNRSLAPIRGALATAPSRRPIFVPRTQAMKAAEPVVRSAAMEADRMETAIRHNLLGGAA